MKPHSALFLTAWIAILIPAHACGPFFPDTMLNHPQAALDVPPVSYLHELYQLNGMAVPDEVPSDGSGVRRFLRQIPAECSELREVWNEAGVGHDEIERRIAHYEEVRHELLAPITKAGPMDFPTHGEQPLTLPVRPLAADFPVDVADYVEAARLHATGNSEEARELWKNILQRPPAERRLRAAWAAWAAWMLAKTSPDLPECMKWYAQVNREIKAGATDAIGLSSAAKAWRAGRMADGPVKAMHFFHDAFVGGKLSAAIDLRRLSRKILDSGNAELFTTAAEDPLVRRLINLELHASLDGPRQTAIEPVVADAQLPWPPSGWLAALQSSIELPLDDGARVAWALYSSGRFAEARKWLELSVKTDPLAIWLQAKFDLRDGNLDAASQHLAEVIETQSKEGNWKPENLESSHSWLSTAIERQHASQGRLMADAGVVALARRDYLTALELLRNANYREDAAYLAEDIISTDGLIKHVRKVAPAWSAKIGPEDPVDPLNCLSKAYTNVAPSDIGPDDQLRYLLARRLTREHRLKEAREFMPPDLLPLLDHYITLDRARREEKYSDAARAAVVWRQALIHRHFGAELFSTDGAPDGGIRRWSFPATDFSKMRGFQNGWSRDWSRTPQYAASGKQGDNAIPSVTADEIRRVKLYSVTRRNRFHYRYAAADLAWEAAKYLPANHPSLARLYNTAGQWLSIRDPKAADRFYQAMVRRCAMTPEGLAADQKHWFLVELEPLGDLSNLPAEFK